MSFITAGPLISRLNQIAFQLMTDFSLGMIALEDEVITLPSKEKSLLFFAFDGV